MTELHENNALGRRSLLKGAAGVAGAGALSLALADTASANTSILNKAYSHKGATYRLGTQGPSTFDCSGLVYYAARQCGVNVGKGTWNQAFASSRIRARSGVIAPSQAPNYAGNGDLIFWWNYYTGNIRNHIPEHVGFYVSPTYRGDTGHIFSAYNPRYGVGFQPLSWYNHFYRAQVFTIG